METLVFFFKNKHVNRMTSALDLVIKMVLATQLRNVQTGEALLLEVVPKDTVFVA